MHGKRDVIVHGTDPFNAETEPAALAEGAVTATDAFYVRNHGEVPEAAGEDEVAEFAVFRPAKSHEFQISRESDGTWVVRGDSVERLFMRWDLENEEAQAHVERRLQRMGVIAALERAGFEPGDDVEIGGTVFELDPS